MITKHQEIQLWNQPLKKQFMLNKVKLIKLSFWSKIWQRVLKLDLSGFLFQWNGKKVWTWKPFDLHQKFSWDLDKFLQPIFYGTIFTQIWRIFFCSVFLLSTKGGTSQFFQAWAHRASLESAGPQNSWHN